MLVGDSAKARKGSSFDHVARLLSQADPAFTARLTTGLSSGEGLIWTVRDPHGPDPGAVDKRLLVIEPEFATVLKSTGRELSTLSPTLRSAWDGRPLALLTRTAPARATERAHLDHRAHHPDRAAPPHHHRRDRQRIPQPLHLRGRPARPAAARRRRPRPAERHRPRPLPHQRAQARPHRRESHAHPRRPRAVVAHLPAAHPARRRSPRTAHRPRRSTRHPARAPLRAARRTEDHPARASPPRARALGLRRPLRRLGARTSDRRPARRADPRRARPLTRRAHPHPDPRPLPTQPPRRPRRASTRRARRRRPRPASNAPSPAAAPPNSGPPRQHPAPDPPPLRASGSHRSPSQASHHQHASRTPATTSWRAINSESEAVSTRDAQPHAPDPAALHCKPFPTRRTPLVVRSFVSPITILDGVVITIQRVRQHHLPPTRQAKTRTNAGDSNHLDSAA